VSNITATTYYRARITSGACAQTNSSSALITVNPASVAGSIAGAATVCSGTNSTTLTLSGQTGSVTRWESSLNNFSTAGTPITNSTTTLTATNLTATTYYRAVVTSGVCAAANSGSATITVSPTSVGGSVAGSATVCTGTNSTTLTLSGHTGTITRWESSLDNFATAGTSIANTTTSLTSTNLSATTYYRAVITSSPCSAANSGVATVTVSPTSVGGSVAGSATVCTGTNSTTLTLSGHTGAITRWESSLDNFATAGTSIANTTTTLTATNLSATTYYRAVITSSPCSAAISAIATVTVSPTSVGGTITGSATVCAGTNSTTLTLSGHTGAITRWESSLNNFSTAGTSIANTTTSLTATNLTATTYYRAVVTNGACSAVNATAATVTVNQVPTTASTSSTQSICASSTASISGNTANVGAGAWSIVSGPSTVTSQLSTFSTANAVFTPAQTGTYTLRWTISNGVCAPSTADAVITVVNAPSAAQFTSNSSTQCLQYSQALDAVAPANGTGAWSIISGPSTATSQFSSLSDANAVFTPAATGSYSLRWTVSAANCSNSSTKNISAVSTTPGGVLSLGGATCSSSGLMSLNSYAGNVVRWESASSPYTSWSSISNTTDTFSSGLLTENTKFRAIVQLPGCPSAASQDILVTINNTTWNGTTWNNGTPTLSKVAIMTGNYNQAVDINACAMLVTNNAVVTIPSNYGVVLDRELKVETGSSMTFESTANLIQNSDVANQGVITYKRSTTPLFRLDYVLWSTPVSSAQKLIEFSPETLTNRFYTYNVLTNLYTTVPPDTTSFENGKGYLIRMPNNWVPYSTTATAEKWTGVFKGVPNNGPFTVSGLIDGGTADTRFNAIGNPYPSPISVPEFLTTNANAIEGTLWFWRKTNDKNNPVSYSTCTSAGCALNNGHSYNNDQVVSAAQGFFVKVKPNQTSVQFTNSMRQDSFVDQFFKTSQRNRFWLDLTDSNAKKYSQNMIAYLPEASANYDEGLDGLYINDNPTVLSSIIDNRELVITAKSTFDAADVVPMQFRTNTAGNYTININHTEGVFMQGQTIYLRDNLTGTVTDLTQGTYTFASAVGTFANRFDVLYQNPLGTNTPKFDENSVVAYSNQQIVYIHAGAATLQTVKVFDIRGRLLATQKNIQANQTQIDGKAMANQVLIVQITDTEGRTVSKKVMN
jgi:hypothetical protein